MEPTGILPRGKPHRPLLNALRERVIKGAVARGASEADARAALAEIESDRPLLDWLANGGLEKIIDLILKLLAAF